MLTELNTRLGLIEDGSLPVSISIEKEVVESPDVENRMLIHQRNVQEKYPGE
jgi:hypothetical protein